MVAGGVLLTGLAALVGLVDPNRPGSYPACPFRTLTGLACPGCGALRSVHALVHGDVLTALDSNAALVLFLPVAAVTWLMTINGLRPSPTSATPRPVAVAALVVLVTWTVVRNLPMAPLTVLAP